MLQERPLRRCAADDPRAITKRCATSCCRRWARSAARPIRRSFRSARAPAACCRCRSSNGTRNAAPSSMRRTDSKTEVPVTGGHCKLQWKADWAMRWLALGIDYEMSGKDLISSVELSSKIDTGAGWRAAGRLQLRIVPRRERRAHFEVARQRPDHRRMADLRAGGKHRAVHVPEAARGQAALFRRHPARRSTITSSF